MKKLSVFVSLSLMLSSLSWAEKYEYIHLKGKAAYESTENYKDDTLYVHDSFSLASGDSAELISVTISTSHTTIYIKDDEGDIYAYDYSFPNISGNVGFKTILAGPCTVCLAVPIIDFIDLTPIRQTWRIKRASDTGSKTLAWNGSEWEGSDDSQLADNNNDISSPVPDPNGIKYDQLLGWCFFTDTPWLYSYTNGSWYYMHSLPDGIYVWNANLPDNGWMKLYG